METKLETKLKKEFYGEDMTPLKIFNMICQSFAIMFCLVEMYLLLFPMFMLAFSNGTYEVTMRINTYGEANIEMLFWAVTFPFVMYGTYLNLYNIFKGDN